MTELIGIAVCRHFFPEVQSVVSGLGDTLPKGERTRFVPIELPALCGRPPVSVDSLRDVLRTHAQTCRVIHVLGSICLKDLPDTFERVLIHRFEQCFSLVASDALIRVLQRDGGYLMTPVWLADWRDRLKRDGFDQDSARKFFGESMRRLVLLDTGIDQESRHRLEEFSDYLQIPGSVETIGLEHVRLQLQTCVFPEQNLHERQIAEETLRDSRKRVSEAMMMADVLGRLAQTRNENDVINCLFAFYQMLFSPGKMVFLPIVGETPGIANVIPPVDSPDDLEDIDQRLSGYVRAYGKTDDGNGFFIRVSHLGELVGVLELHGFALPEYLDRYLDLSLKMSPVVGLAVANARAYSQLLQQIEEIRLLRDDADKANRAKSEFLASTSHELRNSMNGIVGMSELLALTKLNIEQRDYLECIGISGQNLLALVNNVLDLSKIEAGRVELEEIEFNLSDLLAELLRGQNSALLNKHLTTRISLSPQLPERLLGDPLRLKQILLNLVSNAIKFTERGEIVIAVDLEASHEQEVVLRFSVMDTGIGMTPNALEKIFAPFQQADATVSRKYGGSGLGLTICRQLAQLMKGRVWAESQKGKGSSFYLVVPFRFPERPANLQPANIDMGLPGWAWDGPVLHILLVEDDPVNQQVQLSLLEKMGHSAELAKNGFEALEMVGKGTFDLVLMDILMPGLDGIDTLKQIRSGEPRSRKKIPVIAVTAQAFSNDRERLIGEGFDGYVSKPIRSRSLVVEMKRCLEATCG